MYKPNSIHWRAMLPWASRGQRPRQGLTRKESVTTFVPGIKAGSHNSPRYELLFYTLRPGPSSRLARTSWSPKIPSSRALSHGRSSRLLSSMTSGRKSSSSPLLRRVRMFTPSRTPLMFFCSGFHCRWIDPGQFEYLEPAVDRVGYGFGSGHLFPNHIRL